MNQLDIFQSAPPRCARQAVKQALTGQDRLREIGILIQLWHDYTWAEIEAAINGLIETGEIIIAGQWRGQTPESWTENFYALPNIQEAA